MPAYLDCNATTPIDPLVLHAMGPWFAEGFGNATSVEHAWGWDAAEAAEDARTQVAELARSPTHRVVFASGATEALNTILRGYVGFCDWQRKAIVTCVTEHAAVLATCHYLCERTGVRLDVLSVDRCGRLELGHLRAALQDKQRPLVALMAANNETGVIHPVREIAAVVHETAGLLLCDTTQTFGKGPAHLAADGIDLASISAHKLYGPKGIGALFMRSDLDDALEPLLLGGSQERGMRAGTPNVPGIVGLGEACRLVRERVQDDMQHMQRLRDRLEEAILTEVPETWVNGDRSRRLCNTSNIGFRGLDARTLIRDMHDVAVSTRSACSTGNAGPSHVLKAMGLSDEDAYSCIRFSLGRFTTQHEIDYAIEKVVGSVHKLRRFKSTRI